MEHKLAAVNSTPGMITLCKSIIDLLHTFATSSPAEYTAATSSSSPSSPGEPPSVKLSREIRKLSNVLETVRGGYGSDLYSQPTAVEARFWSDIGSAVRDCRTNLQSLENTLRTLAGEGSKGSSLMSIFKGKKSQTRFNQANSEFTVYRHVAQSYREVLTLSLEVSHLAVQSGNQSDRIEELKNQIGTLSVLLRHRAASESVETDADALKSIGVLQSCVASAATLLAEAIKTVQTPLEMDGQVLLAELDSSEAKTRRESQRSSIGTPRERLSQPSISGKSTKSAKSMDDVGVKGATMDVTYGMAGDISPQSLQQQQPPIQLPDTQVHELAGRDEDSDSDWEAELNEGMTSIAQEKYDAGDYAGAEGYLRKIVDGANPEEKYFVLLAVCLIHQEKWEEAEQVLLKLEKSPSQESVSRAQHFLAELYMGTNELEKAKTYANKAMKGKGKLYGKRDVRTAQSIYLFVEILKLMKLPEEAASYSRLLPPDFRPEVSEIARCFENALKARKAQAEVVERKPVPQRKPVPSAAAPVEIAAPDEIGDIVTPLALAYRGWLEEFGLKLSDDRLSIKGEHKSLDNGRTAAHKACDGNDPEILQLLIKHGSPVAKGDNHDNTPIHLAAMHGHMKCVRVLCDKGRFGGIRAGVVVTVKNHHEMTPIHFAANRGNNNPEMLKYLINAGADVNAEEGPRRATPLHIAAETHQDKSIMILLDAGAEIDKTDKRAETPLQYACIHNALKVVKILIERGTNVNTHGHNGETPLLRADVPISEVLLANGAEIDATNESNYTPLIGAVERDMPRKVELLIKHGADLTVTVNGSLFTAIHCASLHQRVKIAKMLLDAGVDPNPRERHDKTPLCFAAGPIAEMLVAAGADIEAQDDGSSRPLHFAVLNDKPEVVNLLIQNKCELNPQDHAGMTPLALSVVWQKKKCFQALIDAGADVNKENNSARPPLHHVDEPSKEMAAIMIHKGADVNQADNYASTALHHAVWRNRPGLVRVLVEHGARHSHDNANYTPLHGCALHNWDACLRPLLEVRTEGFDLEAEDGTGKTPLMRACTHNAPKVARLLVEAGANIEAKDRNDKTALMLATSDEIKKILGGTS